MEHREYPILFVDDLSSNRIVMQHTLGSDYNLIVAESGEQALEILSRQFVSVLLSDQRMPGMSGVDLAERTYQNHPEIIRIIITAYSDLSTTIDAINRGRVNRFIKKPWTYEELVAVIEESITTYHNAQIVKQMRERLFNFDRIRSLGILASGIAHDLRQPLTYIAQYIDLVQRNIDEMLTMKPEGRMREIIYEMKQDLDDVTTGTKMLYVISNSLLDQVANKPIELTRLNLSEVIESVIGIARFTIARSARLEVILPEYKIEMVGCISRLSQLILNLLLNAAQAIRIGSPFENRIILRVKMEDENVIIEVEDTGQGISSEDQNNIFTPLFTTKVGSGSGLGLFICQKNVEDHGGSIEVFSTVGKGSRFVVSLPLNGPLNRSINGDPIAPNRHFFENY